MDVEIKKPLELMDRALLETGQHVAQALLLMDPCREADDPRLRAAYRLVHDLISDLGVVYVTAGIVRARVIDDR